LECKAKALPVKLSFDTPNNPPLNFTLSFIAVGVRFIESVEDVVAERSSTINGSVRACPRNLEFGIWNLEFVV